LVFHPFLDQISIGEHSRIQIHLALTPKKKNIEERKPKSGEKSEETHPSIVMNSNQSHK